MSVNPLKPLSGGREFVPPAVPADSLKSACGSDGESTEELQFTFTQEPRLLAEFHRLYEAEFKAVLKADYHHDTNDEHDQEGEYLIVRRGDECVGGARLSICTPENPRRLPIEMGDFRLENYFPQLTGRRYGQIGRLCLMEKLRGGPVTRMIFWRFFEKAVQLDLDMVFATAPLIIARGHMKHFLAMGLNQTKIHRDIEIPPYPMCENIRFFLISTVTDKSHKVFPHHVNKNLH